MDKEDVVYTHTHTHTHTHIYNRILLSHNKEIMLFAATWTDLEIIILNRVSQKGKDKYCMISLICGILKYDTNEHIYKTETDS